MFLSLLTKYCVLASQNTELMWKDVVALAIDADGGAAKNIVAILLYGAADDAV